jgi:hypothetical protein
VEKAALEAGVYTASAYKRRCNHPEFATAWDQALAHYQPSWEAKFLRLLEEHGNVNKAAQEAGRSITNIYKRRRDHPEFATAWDQALAHYQPNAPEGRDGAPLADGEPIRTLARELHVSPQTLAKWSEWKVHPALGRKMNSGEGSYFAELRQRRNGSRITLQGLLVSRKDAQACVDALRNPLFRRFHGNPGMWIASQGAVLGRAIFRHDDGRLFFSTAQVEYRLKLGGNDVYAAHIRGKLERLDVVYPGAEGGLGVWRAYAYSEDSVEALLLWRSGKVPDGCWLTPHDLWRDGEGNWFSSMFIARRLGIPLKKMFHVRNRYFSRYKPVPRERGDGEERARGSSIIVHHESEVLPLLGLPTAPAATRSAAGRRHTAKARDADAPAAKENAQAVDKGGRKISDYNKPIYRTCNEWYARVEAGQCKMRKAVSEVLKKHGDDALGSKSQPDAKKRIEAQKTRLRMNAKTYRKSREFEGERN